ncbi:hypothetical protein [Nonomuraea sp. NPDC049709]|uniref:hypothetical protein n=1 Tax=Nonomuraea sp. NPDC049709 TaxID=3154736 RepID=UPI003441EFE2
MDVVIAYLAQADPGYDVDPGIRETASAFAVASAFSILRPSPPTAALPLNARMR